MMVSLGVGVWVGVKVGLNGVSVGGAGGIESHADSAIGAINIRNTTGKKRKRDLICILLFFSKFYNTECQKKTQTTNDIPYVSPIG